MKYINIVNIYIGFSKFYSTYTLKMKQRKHFPLMYLFQKEEKAISFHLFQKLIPNL